MLLGFAAVVVVLAAVTAILYQAEVRLTLILAGLFLGCLAGNVPAILQTFLVYFTSEKFLLPIGTCMGFAYVLRHTGCDQHLVHLLLRPLQAFRLFLIPGIVLIGTVVNVPIISQSSTTVAVGAVLVPVLRAARISPTTVGAALALGASIGGELLNPGAPELGTVSKACNTDAIHVIPYVWPLLLVHLAVTVPIFWLICLRAESQWNEEVPQEFRDTFKINIFKALVPLLPLVLLFLTALPEQIRLFTVPETWLVDAKSKASYNVRLIGLAMLIGVVVAALTSPNKSGGTAKAFFEGAGYALTNVTSLIIAAGCFAKGIELAGLADPLEEAIKQAPRLLYPLASMLPLGMAWVSGSGMASTEGLYRFYVDPATELSVDPLRVGAVVSLSAATGRTLSPVAAVVLMAASLTGAAPLRIVRRMAVPMLIGLTAMVIAAMLR